MTWRTSCATIIWLIQFHLCPIQECINRSDVNVARPWRESRLPHSHHPLVKGGFGECLKISSVQVEQCAACVVVAVFSAGGNALQVLPFFDELLKQRFHSQRLISAVAFWVRLS
jgi:hypothetical protein